MDQVRPCPGNLIVHPPRARQLTRATLLRCLKRKERHDVTRICVKYLLVGRVRRAPDNAVRIRAAEILDVREDDVCRRAIELVVLTAALGGDVRGDARVDDDVFLSGVLFNLDAADDEEAVAAVQLVR
jgi:hypothetical protein